jgi:predicted RecB family endonuclease
MNSSEIGNNYEHYVAEVLKNQGYTNVQVTKQSGDYGVDVLAQKGRDRYAVQCKHYSDPVGVKAVQEVHSGMMYYKCDRAMVVTNSSFTKPAMQMAHKLGVELVGNVCMQEGFKPKVYKKKSRLVWWLKFGMYFFGVGMICSLIVMLSRPTSDDDMAACIFTALAFAAFALAVYIPELIRQIKLKRAQNKAKQLMPKERKVYSWLK